MEKKLKIYKDCKELPFWNYKRIVQTGDFFLLVKGYDSGDELFDTKEESEKKFKELEIAFDAIVENYAVSMNMKSDEIQKYGQMVTAHHEIKKLTVIICLIELLQRINLLRENGGFAERPEFNEQTVKNILKDIKVEKCDDLEKQKIILETKITKYKNQLEKSKKSAEKEDNTNEEDFDIDQQFWSVCLCLEMHVDPKLISLYEFGVMVKEAVSRSEAINKANNDGR